MPSAFFGIALLQVFHFFYIFAPVSTFILFFFMTVSIRLDPYLAQWWRFDSGGADPIEIHRGSPEADFLQVFLRKPPQDFRPAPPEPDAVSILLPSFAAKDTRYFFYLSPAAQRLFVDLIRARFDVALWKAVHRFHAVFRRQDDLIYAFMEANGIEPDERNFNAIAKRYQRKRDVYRKAALRQAKKNAK